MGLLTSNQIVAPPNEGWVGLGEQLIHRLKIWLASPGHFTNGKPAGRFLDVIRVIG